MAHSPKLLYRTVFQCAFNSDGDYAETAQPQYMIWLLSETIFQCEFNDNDDYVIQVQFSNHIIIHSYK